MSPSDRDVARRTWGGGSGRAVATLLVLALLAALGVAREGEVPRFGFLGLHGGAFGALERAAPAAGVAVVELDGPFADAETPDLSGYDVVFLQHLREADREKLRDALRAARAANPALRVVSISGIAEDLLPELAAEGIVTSDPRVAAYYSASGPENLERLLRHAAHAWFGIGVAPPPPVEPPSEALFHPARDAPFDGVEDFLDWSRTRGVVPGDAPRAAVVAHHIHRLIQQPRVVAALVEAFERRGVLTAVVEDYGPHYRERMLELAPDVVVHLCHAGDEDVAFREELGAPHLTSLFFRRDSIDAWRASTEGLDASSVSFQITAQEVLGTIEPQIGAGTLAGGDGSEDLAPIPERIEHLVDRALGWIRLRRAPAAEKRVAIVYYDREMGKAELMRGSATGMFLNAPRSVMNVLRRLRDDGWRLERMPRDEDELLARMLDHGRQIGMWDPAELDRLARSGKAVLVNEETYRRWLEEKVPAHRRAELVERWGPPPGRMQVWRREDGERFLVLPVVEAGEGVLLLPQPLRGEAHDPSLAHDTLVPPSHNYLATYFWLVEEYGADALVHFGTHGTEFLLPGKAQGLADDDWCDLILDDLPNVDVWVINNLGESSPARRRTYGVLVDHLVPPSVDAGLSDELLALHDEIDKWATVEEGGALERTFREGLTATVAELGLDRDLGLDLADGRTLTADELDAVAEHLHAIEQETTPVSLHVLGEPPDEELVLPWLVTCLGAGFRERLADARHASAHEHGADHGHGAHGEHAPGHADDGASVSRAVALELVRRVVRDGEEPEAALAALGARPTAELLDDLATARALRDGLARTGDELDRLADALAGRFVPPGPGGGPDKNPSVVPTGRNMYLMNPEEVPARASWELGKALVDELLAAQLATRGRYPERIGFTLNSFATFQDYGVMESQILYLLGVRPVWDARNVVSELEVILLEELGRPRIDVFVSSLSYYRDVLPSRLKLLDEAVRLVAALDEEGNALREHSRAAERDLVASGIDEERARDLSLARIFGYPPGQMGSAGYYYLVERSGEWDTREDLLSTYLAHTQYVYTGERWGEHAPEAYERHIQGTEVILRSWSDRTRSPLSNKYDWYMGGSLSMAVKALTGSEPEYFLSDVRDSGAARMVAAEDALRTEYRVRLFNRKWIEGMMREGYAGADQVAVHVKNTMGWAIMRDHAVDDDLWEGIVDTYVHDRLDLGLRDWFERENPFAWQEVNEILLESIRKGYWDADRATRVELAQALADSVERHGKGGGMLGAANPGLDAFVAELLEPDAVEPAPAPTVAARAEPTAAPAPTGDTPPPPDASAPPDSAAREVVGRELVPADAGAPESFWTPGRVLAAGALALVAAGFLTRRGVPGPGRRS